MPIIQLITHVIQTNQIVLLKIMQNQFFWQIFAYGHYRVREKVHIIFCSSRTPKMWEKPNSFIQTCTAPHYIINKRYANILCILCTLLCTNNTCVITAHNPFVAYCVVPKLRTPAVQTCKYNVVVH